MGDLGVRMKLLSHHLQSSRSAWRSILTQPLEHLVNVVVLGIIILICLVSITIGNNLNIWQNNNLIHPQIIIYLDQNSTSSDIGKVEKELRKLSGTTLRTYKFISRQQALNDLQQDRKLKEIASDVVDENNNPLPDVFIVEAATTNPDEVNRLNLQLSQLPKVEDTHLDVNYANKIGNLVDFSYKIITFVQLICIVIVALVVYNLIRLQMLLKVDAISVSRLIGASDSFIMRPLIHYAVLQVTVATLFAVGGVYFLTGRVNHLLFNLNSLFGKGIQILPLSLIQLVTMWLILITFTIFTVFMAVRWVFRNTYHN